jgi:L-fucose mutarotase
LAVRGVAMLKGIDPRLSAEIVHVLMLMGHGDDLVICDVNHPAASIAAETTYGRMIDMAGCDIPTAARAILTLMPLDTFVPAPVTRMQMVGNPDGEVPVFGRMQAVIDAAEGRAVQMQALERFAFYDAAKRAFAIIRTADSGPYGCFILKKGVVDLPELG